MAILMDVPPEFALRYGLGLVKRYGSILKDVKTGEIVAHLRETPNLINLISQVPANPTQLLSGLIQSSSSLIANYQLYNQDIKIDNLTNEMITGFKSLDAQLQSLTGLTKTTAMISSVGAIASVATFALCMTQFKVITDRLSKIEEKTTDIINRLERVEKNNDKREIRGYLSGIKSSFDYLLSPTVSKTEIENVRYNLSNGFHGLSEYLKHKIDEDNMQLNFEAANFLYGVIMIAAMGEFRCYIILNDIKGASHILQTRKTDLVNLNKHFSYIASSIIANKYLNNSQLAEKRDQLKFLVNSMVDSFLEFDSQRLIVSEYLIKGNLSLKEYYENIDDSNDNEQLIKVVRHRNTSKLYRKLFKK